MKSPRLSLSAVDDILLHDYGISDSMMCLLRIADRRILDKETHEDMWPCVLAIFLNSATLVSLSG